MIGAVFIARDDQEGFTLGPVSHQKKKKKFIEMWVSLDTHEDCSAAAMHRRRQAYLQGIG